MIENRIKNPHIGLKQRLLYDFIRVYISTVAKMLLVEPFDFIKLFSNLPNCLMLMFIAYVISESLLMKHYKDNKLTRTMFNMEYQYLKAYVYIKMSYAIYGINPTSFIFNSFAVDLPEGVATNFGYWIEEFFTKPKACLKGIIRNCKIYLLLNLWTILYFSGCLPESVRIVLQNYVSTEWIFEASIYFTLFIATSDKLQSTFGENRTFGVLDLFKTTSQKISDLRNKIQKSKNHNKCKKIVEQGKSTIESSSKRFFAYFWWAPVTENKEKED